MSDVAMQTQQINVQSSQSNQSTLSDKLSGLNAEANDGSVVQFLDLLTSSLQTNGEIVLADQLKKNAEILGGQISADMLAVNQLLAAMLVNQSDQSQQINQTLEQQVSALESLVAMQSESTATIIDAQITPEIISQIESILTNSTGSSDRTAASPDSTGFSASLKLLATGTNADNSVLKASSFTNGSALLQAQSQFVRAVEQAQQMIKSNNEDNVLDSAVLDIEELQKKVNSGEFLTSSSETGLVTNLSKISDPDTSLNAEDIFNQIKSATTYHTQNGSNDFTMKLSPEGLGEITVRLLEEGGKITMSIAASDTNVQRLLSSELTNLRDIMRPYNVEVAQVVQNNEAQSMDMQQQLQQQFSQHNFSGHHQQSPSFNSFTSFGDSAETDDQAQQSIITDSILDAYI